MPEVHQDLAVTQEFIDFCTKMYAPHICQIFDSQYIQVKLEGPLHLPGIYQSVVGLQFARILLVYVVEIWHTPGI